MYWTKKALAKAVYSFNLRSFRTFIVYMRLLELLESVVNSIQFYTVVL